jgi:DNA-binding response OmpR family regulator
VTPSAISVGDLTLDPPRGLVQRKGQSVPALTRLETRLLEVLMLNHGQVLTAEALIDTIWGPMGGDRAMLKQLVYRLRRKLETDPSQPEYLKRADGVGYILDA